jgi:PAS domain S-box-containing protein
MAVKQLCNSLSSIVNDREESLSDRYRVLFEDSPISLWEEDFSEVKSYLDSLRKKGVSDFRAHFDQNPQSIVNCAALVKVVDVNKATLRLFGAESREVFFWNLNSFFCEDAYNTVRDELVAIAEGKTSFEAETVNMTLQKEKKHVFLRWQAAPGYEYSLSKVLVSIIDITARVEAQEELRRAREEFIAILSHDLKSPLASMMGYVQLIERIVGDKEDLVHYLQMIKEIGGVMLNLIINIAETSRLESHTISCNFTDFSLIELFRELKRTFGALSIKHNISLSFSCPPEAVIRVDITKIRQVFHNLIINAFRHTPDGGSIEISGGYVRKKKRILFEVKDSGCGIPESEQEKVFEKYVQGEGARKGTGLGLYIVKKFLECHGSDIEIESQQGSGTSFRFSLAVASAPKKHRSLTIL